MEWINDPKMKYVENPEVRKNNKRKEKLRELIFQSLGESSMCWKPEPTSSLFDSTKCKNIGEKLYKDIIENIL